jgi:hypothetical protein
MCTVCSFAGHHEFGCPEVLPRDEVARELYFLGRDDSSSIWDSMYGDDPSFQLGRSHAMAMAVPSADDLCRFGDEAPLLPQQPPQLLQEQMSQAA